MPKDNDYRYIIIIYIAMVFLAISSVGLVCLNCIWIDHSIITITVKEKYSTHDQLYAVSNDMVTYCVRSNIDYAKLNEGKTYEVDVAHNPFIGAGWVNKDGTWNIDNVIKEVS